ncbi:sensor histidine kinase [Bradyrhizobium sp. U87765 SZCCT0131]|uniref:sensor histidine kinase n=1 Tax=unclassified Bradyrhizobium TaxID=2631580 RepID=UPI001BA78FD6|nr:sensor histidine kinase [Bradyrhizobium sp. U87765 SZCCT0131]MBR1261358.1 sensor histidine kinase [Bradyrhizobium sp. U87765 SZCCT0134]MBR1303194.1 sensor histidine kinase [Bradyrhizobium sp. U87765 SZCCT0110]MBR1318800.1 sensor histidine kinase [Bradyrhizobium sp. U87765 SZCCT0109]MBR1347125.1 sensor histidine kinase [Bradyrhizobium sp. U87765 SZCCT0048]
MTRPRAPSLRRILLLNLLVPTSVLAIALGAAGALLIDRTVETAYDRVLDGSVRAIAERVSVEDDEVTVDLPQVALGMLETRANDSIYYSVSYDGTAVTGYQDLPLAALRAQPFGTIRHFDMVYKGAPIRLAALAQPVYGKPHPVLIEVAETRNGRNATQRELLLALGGLGAGIILAAAALGWFAVGRGLAPLAALGREIDARQVRTGAELQPLDLAAVPREVHPPVRAINQLFGRLDIAIKVIRDFIADASHQMKTPLASLRVHLALLKRGTIQAAERDTIAEIERSAQHLDRLVAQLVTLARAEQSAMASATAAERTDLRAAAADAISQLAPIAAACDIELALEADSDAVARIAPTVLHEALVNLIDNAIRYNRRGGTVTVRVNGNGERPIVQVIDDGPGIAPEFRERVFDRFYRVPGPHVPSGSGLGLAIVRSLLQQSGATIQLADGPDGRGLIATVSLPREPETTSARDNA